MKKLDELVISTEKPEQRAKKKAITFGSFKRAEERQIAERKEKEHQKELALIAEKARIERELAEEEQRVIREESKRKRSEFITESMSNAFNTKTDVDFKPVREKVIDKYLPQLREQEVLDDYPKPFEAEPALNRELAEFKKKINEHLHKVGFMGSGGGGIGDLKDAGDVDGSAQVDGKFLKFRASDGKFIGDDVAIDSNSLSTNDFENLNISIYPNPVDGNYVTIQTPINGVKEVEVFDILGKRVINTNLISDSLDISELNPGVYMVKVTVENQSKVSKLIIK